MHEREQDEEGVMSVILFSSSPLLFHTRYSCVSDILCVLSMYLSTIHDFRLSFHLCWWLPWIHAPCVQYSHVHMLTLYSPPFRDLSYFSFLISSPLFPWRSLLVSSPEMNPIPLILRWKADYIFYFYSSLRLLIIAADDDAFLDPLFLISLLCATADEKSESNCRSLLLMFLLWRRERGGDGKYWRMVTSIACLH